MADHTTRNQKTALREWLASLDSYANETYGRPISSAVVAGRCVYCDAETLTFTTPQTSATYVRTGLCEHCQATHSSISDNIVPFNQNYRSQSTTVPFPRKGE